MKDFKAIYAALENESIPIFLQPWWLDASKGEDEWDVRIIEDKGTVQLCFVFITKKRGPFLSIGMPALTPTSGLWIPDEFRDQGLAKDLLELLPKHDKFYMQLGYDYLNEDLGMPELNQEVRYTYILQDIKEHDKLYAAFKSRLTGEIKKASKSISINESDDVGALYKLCAMSYKRQGVEPDFSLEVVENIFHACKENQAGTILIASDEAGTPYAAVLLVWDTNKAYYLLNGGNPELRSSGANSLLLWEAIKHCSQFVDTFDFEGSMIPGVEKYIQGYSPEKKEYPLYTHTSSKFLAAAESLKKIVKGK